MDYKSWKNEAGHWHRTDGPAIVYSDGQKEWYINGKLHRADGPAIEYGNGGIYWFINGKQYTKEQYDAMRCTICLRIDCPTKEKS